VYMHVDGSLNVTGKWKANVSVSTGNCKSHKSLNPLKYEACAKLNPFEITANGSVVLHGRTYSIDVTISDKSRTQALMPMHRSLSIAACVTRLLTNGVSGINQGWFHRFIVAN